MFKFFAAGLLVLCLANISLADSIYGTIRYTDGSKAGSEVAVSTSWNGKKATPRSGNYTLDFSGTVKKTLTIYVRGRSVGRVYVSGNTEFNIVIR